MRKERPKEYAEKDFAEINQAIPSCIQSNANGTKTVLLTEEMYKSAIALAFISGALESTKEFKTFMDSRPEITQ